MKKFYLCIIILSNWSDGLPHSPDTIWTKIFGGSGTDIANEIIQTSDGGYVIAGHTNSFGAAQNDVYLIKLDSAGSTIWEKTYGAFLLEQAASIKETHDGGFIIAGFLYGINSNLWLIRTDKNGDSLWTKNVGYSGNEFGTSLQLTDDGGFFVVGYSDSDSISNGDRDVWLTRWDSSGAFLWERTYGDVNAEEGFKILKLSDGNFLISGYTQSAGVPGRNALAIKIDPSGNKIWMETFGSAGFDEFTSAAEDEKGNLFFTGTSDSLGSRDLWIVKTDATGNHIGTKIYGDAEWEWGKDIIRSNEGEFIVVGPNQSISSTNQIWLLKIDEHGDTIWTKLFKGFGGSSIIQTSDNGYAILGGSAGTSNGIDVLVIKLKPEGPTGISNSISAFQLDFSLEQNYPNPFNPSTKIKFKIAEYGYVNLKIYDVLGNDVVELLNEEISPGNYEYDFNAFNLSSGVYFYRLKADDFVKTKKMILIK